MHTEQLDRLVTDTGLDVGIAFDGDADRCLFVDGGLIDGDTIMFVVARHLRAQGTLSPPLVVATVMSNAGLELALREEGIELHRAQVGDRYVLEGLLSSGARLGGEQSGHVIFPDISLAGDGIITAIEVLRAIRASGRSLRSLAADLRTLPQTLVNVTVPAKIPLHELPAVVAEMILVEEELQGRGRLLVRYSGTENLARVMIEGEDRERIEEQARRLADVIRHEVELRSSASS
jgi:phosphoglucosamine mutase